MMSIITDDRLCTRVFIDGHELKGLRKVEFTCDVDEIPVLKLEMCIRDENIEEVK